VGAPSRAAREAPAAEMDDRGGRQVVQAPAGFARAPAPVRILEVEEDVLVERPDLLPDPAAHEQARAAEELDGARRVALVRREVRGRDEPEKARRQARRTARDAPGEPRREQPPEPEVAR